MNFLIQSDFPDGKTTKYRKPPLINELFESLILNDTLFPPVHLDARLDDYSRDIPTPLFSLHATWSDKAEKYVVEDRSASSPRDLRNAISIARAYSQLHNGFRPLVILPYLSEDALKMLDAQDMSGLDLCGNGILLSEHFRILRTGYPNLYKGTRPIRNPYVGDSSVFVRAFLLQSEFTSLTELRSFVIRRMFTDVHDLFTPPTATHFTLGTASKVVKTLEDELVVRKEGDQIILQDANRLTNLLRRGQRPTESFRLIGKTSLSNEQIWAKLLEIRQNNGIRSVATGLASAGHYGVLSGIDKLSLYVDNLQLASNMLEIQPGRAFANVELIEDRKNVVYFDSRTDGNVHWASPIQTWLELASAGPREHEAAGQLEQILIDGHGAEL
jgi:hypothetical protein